MKSNHHLSIITAIIVFVFQNVLPFKGAEASTTRFNIDQSSTDTQFATRLIVKLAPTVAGAAGSSVKSSLLSDMTQSTSGIQARLMNEVEGYQVYGFNQHLTANQYAAVVSELSKNSSIVSVEEDRIFYPDTLPNDPLFSQMIWLQDNPPVHSASIDAVGAWSVTTGDKNLTIAVLDTGMEDHPDMAGRWLPGYDFISDPKLSGDGDGWDSDPHDTGYNTGYNGVFHGLHVAGTIGAIGDNHLGVAGLNWSSPILPVRVLGWGGGYESDIAAGLVWAMGLPVSGVPINPDPARVFNLSLGGVGDCPDFLQNAINTVYSAGGIIVAAAGNNSDDVSTLAPANCDHVIPIANIDPVTFDKHPSSNFGAEVTIGAPGTCILSTVFDGKTTLGNPAYATLTGTSMAAPQVTGVISLMLSVKPSLTFEDVVSILKTTATAYPASSACVTMGNVCGAGFLNANAAVLKASGEGTAPTTTPTPTTVPTHTTYLYIPMIQTGNK